MRFISRSELACLVTLASPLALAAGYNESNPAIFGVEQFQTYTPVDYQGNGLRFSGFLFGKTASNGVQFLQWSKQMFCGPGIPADDCTDYAISNATWWAANSAAVTGYRNLADIALIQKSSGGNAAYYVPRDIGQGPSCSTSTDDAYGPQVNNCTGTGPETVATASNFFPGTYVFNSRGIKVTCKNACNTSNAPILQPNMLATMRKVVQGMRDGNYFAARFALWRVNPDYVIARCRLTIPNVAQFGMDGCPDSIPAWGAVVDDDRDRSNQ